MEKKIILPSTYSVKLNQLNSGSKALFHTPQQAHDLVTGKFKLNKTMDVLHLLNQYPVYKN